MYKLIIHRGYTVLDLQWEIVVKTTYNEDGTNYKIPKRKKQVSVGLSVR